MTDNTTNFDKELIKQAEKNRKSYFDNDGMKRIRQQILELQRTQGKSALINQVAKQVKSLTNPIPFPNSPTKISSIKNHPTINPDIEGIGITEFIINTDAKSPRMIQWIMRGFFFNAIPHINQTTLKDMGDELQSLLFGDRAKSREYQKTDAILTILEEADRLLESENKKLAKKHIKAVELVVEDLVGTLRYNEIKEVLEEMYDRLMKGKK